MNNPALAVPGALESLRTLQTQAKSAGIPDRTLHLVYLRASQINGCSFCLDMHAREAKQDGETDQRLATVAGFREAPWFSAAERAALALTEALTRIADREEAVSDAVFAAAREQYDEPQLAALILNIGVINLWNRLNVAVRQPPGGRPAT